MTKDYEIPALGRLDQLGEPQVDDEALIEGSPGWQMAVSIVLPGIAAVRRRPLTAVLMLLAGVLLPVLVLAWIYSNRADLVAFALNQRFLMVLAAVAFLQIVARAGAVLEVARTFRRSPGIGGQMIVALAVVLAIGVPVAWGGWQAVKARGVVAEVFAGGSDESVFEPSAEELGPDPDAIRNILLLGSDAGPGRWGARTDTMILVTVHEASGRASLVSIPRNLVRLQFPSETPMGQEFPDGFNAHESLTNAVFTYVDGRQDLLDHYGASGQEPHAMALSEGIGYSLGVRIDDFALVNMQGFAEVIDAVGGVTVNLESAIPLPPVEGTEVPDSIGPGEVHLDGPLAIAFARSREADSDYARMGRQRMLLAALGSQVSATEAARGFSTVTSVLDDSMRTSLTADEFSELLTTLGSGGAVGESVGLAPPLVETGSPNYDEIKGIVDAVENYVRTGDPSGYAT